MDGTLGSATIKPDQMGIVNPLLIIAITPIFNSLIYPLFKKCGLLTPLQRIGTGGFLIGLAFVISGIVELNLEVWCQQRQQQQQKKEVLDCNRIHVFQTQTTYPRIPAAGLTQFNFINTLPCSVNISYTHAGQPARWMIVDSNSFTFERDLNIEPVQVQAHLLNPLCGNMDFSTGGWTGIIEGASSKVIICVSLNLHFFEITQYVSIILNLCWQLQNKQGIFCCHYWPEWETGSRAYEHRRTARQSKFRTSSCRVIILPFLKLLLCFKFFFQKRF